MVRDIAAAAPRLLLGSPAALRARLGGVQLALMGILVAAAGLRISLIHAWRPAFLGYPDAIGYIDAARLSGSGLVFWNPYRPAGYPLFLSWLHGIHTGLAFPIDVQHGMGLAAAVLLYLAVARFTRRKWVALLPAAVVALSGSELYLEHSALSETLYTFLVVSALWCASRSIDSAGTRELSWLLAAGILIGLSGAVRPVGVFLAPVVIVWAAASRRGRWRRLACPVVLALGFVLSLGGYLAYQHSKTATWGLTHTTGETLYARAAIFANCRDFTPPAGTRELCQPPTVARQGATWYIFDGGSPAVQAFGLPPDPRNGGAYSRKADGKLASFAVAAITHQPLEYLWTTIEGLVKYVAPTFGSPTMLEWSHDTLIDNLPNPRIGAQAAPELAAYYPNHPVVHHNIAPLDAYARAARVEGPVTAVLLVLTLFGLALARGRRRAVAWLFASSTAMMMLAPVALLVYGTRYATPSYGPLAAAAACGLDELAHRTDVADIRGPMRRAVRRPGRAGRSETQTPERPPETIIT